MAIDMNLMSRCHAEIKRMNLPQVNKYQRVLRHYQNLPRHKVKLIDEALKPYLDMSWGHLRQAIEAGRNLGDVYLLRILRSMTRHELEALGILIHDRIIELSANEIIITPDVWEQR